MMKTMFTMPKLNHHEEELTVSNLNHHEDETIVPKAEPIIISVEEVVDTEQIYDRNEKFSMKIMATCAVAVLVLVTAVITIHVYLGGKIASDSVKDVTGEIHIQKIIRFQTEKKYEIPGSDQAIDDFEKGLLVNRAEISSTPVYFVTAFDTSDLKSPDVMMGAVVFDKRLCRRDNKPEEKNDSCGDLLSKLRDRNTNNNITSDNKRVPESVSNANNCKEFISLISISVIDSIAEMGCREMFEIYIIKRFFPPSSLMILFSSCINIIQLYTHWKS